MPEITVLTEEGTRTIPFECGSSLRTVLDGAGVPVRWGCLGNGACGLCLVEILAGDTGEPAENERLMLTAEQIERHMRLACYVTPQEDLRIRVVNPASKPRWRELPPAETRRLPPPVSRARRDARGYGLAVDLGTTHIRLTLWDLAAGRRLAGRLGPNPQAGSGADVVTRLIAASASPETAHRIGRLPLAAIHAALVNLCAAEGIGVSEVARVCIVGNTPMLTLLTESDARTLLQPSSWAERIECAPRDPSAVVKALRIAADAAVEIVQPLAGFVGSDLLAGVLATGLVSGGPALLIDFGTNSEIALWDGTRLFVTSAAGGPAFESSELQCGMPAEPGAIHSVVRDESGGGLEVAVIGGRDAKGVCGSGLVDLVACLLAEGHLSSTGKLAPSHAQEGFILRSALPSIRLTNGDVDMFQRAKGAIGAGVTALLATAGMHAGDLTRVCVCGAFGGQLDTRNAQLVGLIPDVPAERVELCGDSALSGCEELLLTPSRAAEVDRIRETAVVLNLSAAPDFEVLFLENLYLRPLVVDGR
jgi:uncharacterized 2Fe-2S/4Fe-4S cluster protein (DUF4445 family)